MSRFDKYDPISGGFRAPLNANYTGAPAAIGVGINSSGRVVVGAGQTGVVGVICSPYDKIAGDIIDVMTEGEIVEFGGAAGTVYYAHASTGVISTTASLYRVGHTVEAGRLIVRMAPPDDIAAANLVTGDQPAIVHLTNSTGVTPDNTIDNLTAVVAAAGEATAADLTTTQTAFAEVKDSLSDLAGKIEEILDMVEAAGLLTP